MLDISVSADARQLLRLILDTPWMRELSVAEQRYQAVLAVISDGLSLSQVAEKVGVSRQTLHTWLARYEARGLDGLVDRSHRPASCPHQMPAAVEAALLELRRSRAVLGRTSAIRMRVVILARQDDLSTRKFARQRKPNRCNNFRAARLA